LRSKRQFSLKRYRAAYQLSWPWQFHTRTSRRWWWTATSGPELSEGNQAQIGVLLVILEPGRGNNIPDLAQDFFVGIMG